MSRAFVGLPDDGPAATCGYGGLDITEKGCADPAQHHLVSWSDAWGVVSLRTCAVHRPAAVAAGHVQDEHSFRPDCVLEECWRTA